MLILIGVFGFFALMSAVALVKFEGNPLFIFTLLLCATSLVWLVRLHREDAADRGTTRRRSRGSRR